MKSVLNLIKNSKGISIGLCGVDPFKLINIAKKIPELVEGFPPTPSDYLVIDPEGEDIGIDEIRGISTFFAYSPEVSKRKYVLIFDVDRMTQQAANAFLKTLEEPQNFGVIICTTSRWNYLLPTIRSRLVKITIPPEKVETGNRRIDIVFERDSRTVTDNWSSKLKKVEKMNLNELIKTVKKFEDPLMAYLSLYKLLDLVFTCDVTEFTKIYDEVSSSLSGKEFFLFNARLARVALWDLEVSKTENVNLVRFLDAISRAKIANFNNSLTLLNIMIRYREEKRGESAWN